MQSTGAKVMAGIVALVAVIVLFVVLSGGDDESTPESTSTTVASTTTSTDKPDKPQEPEVPTIEVDADGKPVGGVAELTFTEGDDIQFKVESAVADEVHFHGYDIGEDVEAGGSVSFDVPATITGEFEVEMEERVSQIAEITVNPS